MTIWQANCKGNFVTKASAELAPSLKERHGALTRQLILEAAVAELEAGSLAALTLRGVAARANLAERTIFRYFATRDELLDAVADEVSRRLELPQLPATAAELVDTPRALYRAFEAHAALIRSVLRSELFDRIRESAARARWIGVSKLVDAWAPDRSARERKLVSANIRYLLSATSWHYYRFYFGFSQEDSVAAAEMAVRLALKSLRD
jgi:AcrR family transcriptional regulator